MIVGFEELSTIDYPNIPSSVVYFWGCNLRCPYCYNPHLVTEPCPSTFSINEIIIKIENASRFIDGVVLTGGEPMLYPNEVKVLADAIHSMGLKVKLDTNGMVDLKEWLPAVNRPDYIALDVKTSQIAYKYLGAGLYGVQTLEKNIKWIKDSGIDYEFRTTMVHPFITTEAFPFMARMVSGAKKLVLQKARLDGVLVGEFLGMKPVDDIEYWAKRFKPYVDKIEIRQ